MRNHSVIPFFLLLSFSAFAQQSIPDVSVAFGEQSSQNVSVAFGEQSPQDAAVAFGEQSSQDAPPSCAEQSFPDAPLYVRQQFVSVDLDRPAFLAQPEVDLRQWQPYDPLTMGMQALFGAVGGVSGAIAAYKLSSGESGLGGFMRGIVTSYFVATLVTAPLGVYLGGEFMGGNGSFVGTIAGGAAGSLIGIAALSTVKNGEIGFPIAYAAAIVSPIIGYHLLASPDSTETDTMRSELTRPPVHPVVKLPVDPVTPRPDFEMTLLSLPL
ncbi:MAG: hypothetical protein WC824_07350 [Bacteroidota bacterium]|jgi:hypothetical protein